MAGNESSGRLRQKHRTRTALKVAAAALIDQGMSPSVAEVADAAAVSRSTAYRYFASAEILQAEVLLDVAIRGDLEQVYSSAEEGQDAGGRLDHVVQRDHQLVVRREAAFRTALRAMVNVDATAPAEVPRRPGNRLRYLAAALEPVRDQLSAENRERLIAALALCVGIESVLVTRDICGLSDADAEDVKRWAARALLRQALDEA